jgi:hypothetical protein
MLYALSKLLCEKKLTLFATLKLLFKLTANSAKQSTPLATNIIYLIMYSRVQRFLKLTISHVFWIGKKYRLVIFRKRHFAIF